MTIRTESDREGFACPPLRLRPYQIVHDWGGDPRGKLARLSALGIGGVVTNVPWNESYLRDPSAFRELDLHLEEAGRLGLGVWLYDEKGYPSGSAGGLTLEGNPGLEATGLYRLEVRGSGTGEVTIPLPGDGVRFLHASLHPSAGGGSGAASEAKLRVEDRAVAAQGTDGDWVLHAYVIKRLYEGTHAENNGWSPRRYPNLLDERAVERFIGTTYEPYAAHIGRGRGGIGGAVSAFFTDEPSLMAAYQNTGSAFERAVVPWAEELPALFRAEHGEELASWLYALFEGDGEAERTVRIQFYRTVADLLAVRYFRRLASWCEARGIRFSGHALLEESMVYHTAYYGSLMRVLREMTLPGVDMLTTRPHTYIDDPFGYLLAPKFVGSAARAAGKRNVMAEVCPVRFSPSGEFELDGDATLQEMTGTANLLYMHGITHINSYYRAEEMEDGRYRRYCEHVGRLGFMLEDACHQPDLAVYYGIESYQADYKPIRQSVLHQPQAMWDRHERLLAAARGLLAAGLDFNFLDDWAIGEADLEEGALRLRGMAYRVVLMCGVEAVPLAVLRKLRQLEAAGGRVVWADSLPSSGIRRGEHAEIRERVKRLAPVSAEAAAEAVGTALAEIGREPAIQARGLTPGGRLFASRYRKNGGELLFLQNAGSGETEASLEGSLPAVWLADPATGSVRRESLPCRIRLPEHGGLFVEECRDDG